MDSVKQAFNTKLSIMDVLKILGILVVIVGMYYSMDARVTVLEKDLTAQEKRCTNRHDRQEVILDKITIIRVKE